MTGIPEHLLRRSAEAKARATGRPVEEILAELMEEAEEAAQARRTDAAAAAAAAEGEEEGPAPAADQPGAEVEEPAAEKTAAEEPAEPPAAAAEEPAEPPAAAAEEPAEPPAAAAEAPPAPEPAAAPAAALPEHLLRRSAEAKAKATGRPVEEILAEMQGGPPPPPPAEPAAAPAAEAPAPPVEVPAAPAPAAPAAAPPAAAEAPPAAAAALGEWDLPGVPAHLIARSQAARAKADGLAAPAAAAPAAAAPAAGAPAAATATAAAPQPSGPPTIPEGVRTQRLLTVVKAGAIQQVKTEPTDKVNTWPHLIAAEFVALLVVTAALTIFSAFVDAPLLELANFNEQPNPSKAPWYFLGLQELLSYFDPQVAGVLIPGLGLAGMAAIPYIDRNPSTRPADRKLAIMIFTFFMMGSALLTIWGSFYRGPGFNFTFPWNDGLFFDF